MPRQKNRQKALPPPEQTDQNGGASNRNWDPSLLERFDPENRQYTTESGYVIEFYPISAGIIDRVQQAYEQKFEEPEPPLVEVDHGKNRTSFRRDTADPGYVLEYNRWQTKVLRALNEWLFANGLSIKTDTPIENAIRDAVLKLEEEVGIENTEASEWYTTISSITTTDEYKFLSEAVVSNSSITQEGLAQAQKDFPGNG